MKGNTPLEDKLWLWSSISGGVAKETNEFVHANGTVTIGPSIPNTGDFQGLQVRKFLGIELLPTA